MTGVSSTFHSWLKCSIQLLLLLGHRTQNGLLPLNLVIYQSMWMFRVRIGALGSVRTHARIVGSMVSAVFVVSNTEPRTVPNASLASKLASDKDLRSSHQRMIDTVEGPCSLEGVGKRKAVDLYGLIPYHIILYLLLPFTLRLLLHYLHPLLLLPMIQS
jgi:hypothetical protein